MPRPEDEWSREIAFAKINLALHVRARRDDGYHLLETLFAFCKDGDVVLARPADELSMRVVGPFGEGLDGDDNLVMRAARALREVTGAAGAEIVLDKRLPVASGIGGGSADAAATLRLLTRLWGTDSAHMAKIAITLGADVLACLFSMTARGEGVGDVLSPVETPEIENKPVLLVNPRVGVSTAQVFREWDSIDRGPLEDWREGRNDLEAPARTIAPQIDDVLDWLGRQDGVELVRMSGSGATCFALFDTLAARDAAASGVPDKWWHLASELR